MLRTEWYIYAKRESFNFLRVSYGFSRDIENIRKSRREPTDFGYFFEKTNKLLVLNLNTLHRRELVSLSKAQTCIRLYDSPPCISQINQRETRDDTSR